MIRKDLPMRTNLTDGGSASDGSGITLYQNPIISPIRSDLGDPAIVGVIIPPPAIVYPKQFAFSIAQRIVTGYNGSLIRVRRSSDNATQNIGLSGSNLDTTSLLSFVGANDGFVTTIYDQFNGGADAFQNTASKQAKIVNSGSLITIGSSPAILFDGVDDGYFLPDNRLSENYTINTTFEPTNNITSSTGLVIFSGNFDNRAIGLTGGNVTGSIGGETLSFYSARIFPFSLAAKYETANITGGTSQNVIITVNHNTSVITATRNGLNFAQQFGTFNLDVAPTRIDAIGGNNTLTGSFLGGKIRDLYFEDLN